MKDKKAIVKYGNKCDHRIYARYCNEKNNGKWECGADGIRPGGTKVWSTYNASGRTNAKAIGSVEPEKDWVCTDSHQNWRTPS